MSKIRVAINGFGRVGRAFFKIARELPELEIVAINDLSDNDTLAYLLKHDTLYGAYGQEVSSDQTGLIVASQHVRVLTVLNPAELPWESMGVDLVIESTGSFTSQNLAERHLHAGAKKVIVTAALRDEGEYIIFGANDGKLHSTGQLISMGSCTGNAVAPLAKILKDTLGAKDMLITNIHSYTNDQPLQDSVIGRSTRASRAAGSNIIPISSNVGKVISATVPDMGSVMGSGYRVPVQGAAVVELVFNSEQPVDFEQVNSILKDAAAQPYYKGIIDVSSEQLVSTDYVGNPSSCVVDLGLTQVASEHLVKVVAWYDNEWGYASRLVELAAEIGRDW